MLFRPLSVLLCMLGMTLSFAQTEFVVHFDTDKDQLDPSEKRKFQRFLEKLSPDEYPAVRLSGHTDERASDAYNEALALRRANYVGNLITQEFPAMDPKIFGFGERQPVAKNSSSKGRWANRRVEIYFYQEGELGLLEPEGTQESDPNGWRLPYDAKTWTSAQGIEVSVPEDAEFDYVEVTDQAGMLQEKMYTVTGDEGYLESDYMFCMEVTEGKVDSVLVEVPAHMIEDAMQLYAGEGREEAMRWNLTAETKEDFYKEECNCYALWVPPGCYNFDKPMPKSEQVIFANYDRRMLKRKLLWIIPIYEKVEPEFVFRFDGRNAVITPAEVTKKTVMFTNVPRDTKGTIISEIQRGKNFYVINEEVESVDAPKRWKRSEWMSFERLRKRSLEGVAMLPSAE